MISIPPGADIESRIRNLKGKIMSLTDLLAKEPEEKIKADTAVEIIEIREEIAGLERALNKRRQLQ